MTTLHYKTHSNTKPQEENLVDDNAPKKHNNYPSHVLGILRGEKMDPQNAKIRMWKCNTALHPNAWMRGQSGPSILVKALESLQDKMVISNNKKKNAHRRQSHNYFSSYQPISRNDSIQSWNCV